MLPPLHTLVQMVLYANTIVMMTNYWEVEKDMVPGTSFSLGAAHVLGLQICSFIFYVEAVLKVLAFGVDVYVRDEWCRFELLLLIPPSLEIIDPLLWPNEPLFVVGYNRALNTLRVLRLLKDAKEVRDVITKLVLTLPSLVNVANLLLLFIYVYAVAGTQLFTYVEHQDAITADRNFETFGNALLLLIQVRL